MSIGACSYMIRQVWLKWDRCPVIVTFAESSTPVWQVPFPAVTICSETKSLQTAFNYTYAFNNRMNLTDEELRNYGDVSLVCDSNLYNEGKKFTDYRTVEYLKEVAPKMDYMFWSVNFRNKMLHENNLFQPLLTEDGLCFSFNMLDATDLFTEQATQRHEDYLQFNQTSDEWTLESGYVGNAGTETYPNRILGAGARFGLTVLLRLSSFDLDYICRGPVQGFKILLHNPAEFPPINRHYFRVPLNQEVIAAVRPNMMTTSEGLRGYSPHRRQCYFPYERHLRFFRVYTQHNCNLECLTNYTLQSCGCVSYYMPRAENTPICGSGSTECVQNSTDNLVQNEIEEDIQLSKDNNLGGISNCDCMPACTVLEYDTETSQADFDWRSVFAALESDMSEIPGLNLARVSIYFKDIQFITSRRSELYGQTDFLANCGGLLGLFMGFSLLSLIEMIYYFTIRVGCTILSRKGSTNIKTS